MTTLVMATRNRHKVEELRALLGPGPRYRALEEFPDAPAVVEDADTFAGNAARKAIALARWLAERVPATEAAEWLVLADDSGLEVDALSGAPGVHSARFAALEHGRAGNSTDAENNARLLRLLAGVPPAGRTARFRCAIAVTPVAAVPSLGRGPAETEVRCFEGVCEGRVLTAARGTAGFGYDPLFEPDGFNQTFAELGATTKNRISHRARALEALKAWWREKSLAKV